MHFSPRQGESPANYIAEHHRHDQVASVREFGTVVQTFLSIVVFATPMQARCTRGVLPGTVLRRDIGEERNPSPEFSP